MPLGVEAWPLLSRFRMARLPSLSLRTLLVLSFPAYGQVADIAIEQSRQFAKPPAVVDGGASSGAADFPDITDSGTGDDAFGAQVIMKEQPRVKPFTAFAEVAAFFTNNVGLARRAQEQDGFMIASLGAAYSRPLAGNVRLDTGVRSSVYRYAEYRELDFQSVDASIGLAWSPPVFRGTELLLRYTFTDLTTAEHGFEFFKNHAILVGAQKAFSISRAQIAYGGVSAQWSWADPREAGRDEYSAFLGTRVQATRSVEVDLFYRYGRFVYRDAAGRQDGNHSISLTARYAPAEWFSVSASGFAGFNRSNRAQFDYDVVNVGCAVQGAIRF